MQSICFVCSGVNGAVNGSEVCPPTTQSGSFSVNLSPVQSSTKPNPDAPKSHHRSPQNSPPELVEKIPKTKEKVSPETLIAPQIDKKGCEMPSNILGTEADSVSSFTLETTKEGSRHLCSKQQRIKHILRQLE